MDADRFDRLTRALRTGGSRRAAVGSLLAGSFGLLTRSETAAKKKGRADRKRKTGSEGRNTTAKVEACIPSGKQCPAKKPRGKKGGNLSCNDCCQGVVVQVTNRKGKRVTQCSCRDAGTACDDASAAECCGGAASCQGGICGGPPATCGAANCQGCCAGGSCREGDTQNSCGRGGVDCAQCGSGAVCDAGVCRGGGETCTPETCNGCCDGTTCREGVTENNCGRDGVACVPCDPGSTCEAGACQAATCSPDNCNGCCDDTTCREGSTSNFCGRGGSSCNACNELQVCAGGFCFCPHECCEDFHCEPFGASRCTQFGTCEACIPNGTSPGPTCFSPDPPVPCCSGSCLGTGGNAYCGCLPNGVAHGGHGCNSCCSDTCDVSGNVCAPA